MTANSWYEQKWTPIHFKPVEWYPDIWNPTPEPDPNEWIYKNCVDDGKCEACGNKVGQCWWITSDDTDACDWTDYWQMDEDAEHLLCEDCYAEATKEIGPEAPAGTEDEMFYGHQPAEA